MGQQRCFMSAIFGDESLTYDNNFTDATAYTSAHISKDLMDIVASRAIKRRKALISTLP